MFDIGPSELVLIFIVALLVIGPEKLPSTIKTASLWVGRFRRSFHKIKADVERELNADEIKRQLHNESILEEVEKAKSSVDNFAKDIENVAADVDDSDETDLRLNKETATGSSETSAEPKSDSSSQQASSTGKNSGNENSIAGELKQAVSYVNDISRDVKDSAKEMETEFSKPKPEAEKKPKSSEEK
jgi:sec-independent protein translocase protein TatB